MLVGFPGETERAFQNLLAFVEDAGFDRLGVFTYSAEEGTPAADMADQVPAEVMAERAAAGPGPPGPARLAAPEGALRHAPDRAGGRAERGSAPSPSRAAPAGQAPEIDGVVLLRDRALTPGRFAEVRIVEVEGYELVGE